MKKTTNGTTLHQQKPDQQADKAEGESAALVKKAVSWRRKLATGLHRKLQTLPLKKMGYQKGHDITLDHTHRGGEVGVVKNDIVSIL